MARGHKTGGRTAGTLNKRTAEVEETLAALGCNPIEGMARIALDESNSIELRARMFVELAPYIAPRRKAVEAQVTAQVNQTHLNTIDSSTLTREQRKQLRAICGAAMANTAPPFTSQERGDGSI